MSMKSDGMDFFSCNNSRSPLITTYKRNLIQIKIFLSYIPIKKNYAIYMCVHLQSKCIFCFCCCCWWW